MGKILVKKMDREQFMEHYNTLKDTLFDSDHSYKLYELLSHEDKSKMESLRRERGAENIFRLFLAAFDDDKFIGWSWGFEEDSHTYYMCNSAVLPQYRRKGIYSQLLSETMEILQQRGYQKIYSRHCATNNSVLIPKLKAGFVITNMQLDDIFGVLIHLSYFTNPIRRKILDYRSGQLRPDEEIKEIFQI